ncbi:hypothetical protein NIES4101_66050 [Calothrix sp. NIES-4101]|nr:hypothetical protein NIES4101_66050 [Calothrix sp. NIES-4101]
MNVYPAELVAFWREVIAQQWGNPTNIAGIICSQLRNIFLSLFLYIWDVPKSMHRS